MPDHTPGNWIANEKLMTVEIQEENSLHLVVAMVSCGNFTGITTEEKADLKLIAAAPRLLKALRAVQKLAEDTPSLDADSEHSDAEKIGKGAYQRVSPCCPAVHR